MGRAIVRQPQAFLLDEPLSNLDAKLRVQVAPATFVSLVIPLAVYFAFQRYFVQGLLAGPVR